MPGWRGKICPQVTGLPQREGEFIIARILKVAHQAGAPLDGESCKANLDVFITAEPAALLKGLEKHDSYDLFGPRGRPYLLDQFIATARPVRVWYNLYGGPPVTFDYSFTHVVVVVDSNQVKGISAGQLADYVAMVGLAEIKPGAQLGDAPSVLTLFDESSQPRPTGLSDWDQALLRSLYSSPSPKPWKRQLGRTDSLTLSMIAQLTRRGTTR